MQDIDIKILDIDKVICKNISKFKNEDRGLLSQNILSQLRNFIEYISFKAYSNGENKEFNYINIQNANEYVKTKSELNFLNKFHKLIQISASHYTLNEENSERLMLKYYEYLIKIKSLLKNKYDLDVLKNINEFPIEFDNTLNEYYLKISEKINNPQKINQENKYNDRYYVKKIRPFFIENEVYYEITFTIAHDNISKFDRIIAFTKLNISDNYSVEFHIRKENINIFGKEIPINIIDDWKVSIRPCEFTNLLRIFGVERTISRKSIEYLNLMSFLKHTGLNLVEIVDLKENIYNNVKDNIIKNAKSSPIFEALDYCRDFVVNNRAGCNVIRYLLYRLNNKIIKNQYYYKYCSNLSNLKLKYGCIPFDQMPFNTSLINHNPNISDLFECLNYDDREHELLARHIKNNTENKAQLYTPQKDITFFENIKELMTTYNKKLYYKHTSRKLEDYKNHIYINSYEENTIKIVKKIIELSSSGLKGYKESIDDWLKEKSPIDCKEKVEAIRNMFTNSKVSLIYGAAGTGKSTMINHISNFFNNKEILYLANTNPAIDNLKRKVIVSEKNFYTISRFKSNSIYNKHFDLVVIDECSTVSNIDMAELLDKLSFELLVLVGDIYQIESIVFGNWFNILKYFVPKTSIFELTKPYRSENKNLLELWSKVRNIDDDILEHITKNNYSMKLDESIFKSYNEDEIILCLNYDGIYGINNINSFLQISNPNMPVKWGVSTYKKNDPILFNESCDRFSPLIYNNLKGKIINIVKSETKIQFDIEIHKKITELDVKNYELELIGNSSNGNSVIRFSVDKYKSTDNDDYSNSNTIIPFQIAYVVSIHKAQGLEYNSVKIIVTEEVEEMISHNIFYTAITRAKNKLKIYWTPETEKKVLNSFEKNKINNKDIALISKKFKLKKVK